MREKRVQQFDLHGHTNVLYKRPFYFEGISYFPFDAVSRAKQIGLDGIAITDHDSFEGVSEALDVAEQYGLIVVPGIEITGWDWKLPLQFPHIIALGIDPHGVPRKEKIPIFRHPETVIHWIHNRGGIAIAAHPTEHGTRTSLSFSQLKRLSDRFEGVETKTTFFPNWEDPRLSKIAIKYGLAEIGVSDFHLLGGIGLVRTRIFRECQNWMDVIHAIRQKQTEPFIRADIHPELRNKTYFSKMLR